MEDRLKHEGNRGRVEAKTRLLRWAAAPPAETLVLQAAGWTGPKEPSEPDRSAARAAAAEAARLAQPVAAVRWLAPGEPGWGELLQGSSAGAARAAAVAVTIGADVGDAVRAHLFAGELAAGVWLEAAGNALLAEETAVVRAGLAQDLAGAGPGAVNPVLLWVAPGCHGLPVERLGEVAMAAGGEAAGITPLPGGGLRPGKSVAGLFVLPDATSAGERLRRRLNRECAGCLTRWCPGRAVKPEERG